MISFRVRLSFFRARGARVCGHDPFAQAHVDCPGSRFPGQRSVQPPAHGRGSVDHLQAVDNSRDQSNVDEGQHEEKAGYEAFGHRSLCRSGGLSPGFDQAGFDVVTAVAINPVHYAVHEFNFPYNA